MFAGVARLVISSKIYGTVKTAKREMENRSKTHDTVTTAKREMQNRCDKD